MTSKFDFFLKNKINNLYLPESMQTDLLQMLDEYLDEKDTTYSYYFDLWPDWLYQNFNEIALGETIESAYLMWKSEQHRLTPKYDILRLLVTLVKTYFMTM